MTAKLKRKVFLRPYFSGQDFRLNWLEKEFLGYLAQWKASVMARKGFTKSELAMMCISNETLEGLHMTGTYIIIPITV